METMKGLHRTHSCGTISAEQVGQEVVLCGWVERRRDHGGLIFIDLRDRSGVVQIVASPDHNMESFHKFVTLLLKLFFGNIWKLSSHSFTERTP